YLLRDDEHKSVYALWAVNYEGLSSTLRDDTESYLDLTAEIAWELVVKPYLEKLANLSPEKATRYDMSYAGLLPGSSHAGRRYLLSLDEQSGATQIYVDGTRFYIIAAWGAQNNAENVERFLKSFTLNTPAPQQAADEATGVSYGPGRSSNESVSGSAAKEAAQATDDNRTFKASGVTRKANLTSKPEPSYTEGARKFGVTGTVRLRLVLSASGTVSGITPITRLPHGLTREAVEAARRISFIPAEKDGRRVSQYVTIEYNFNLY
ncbi:MAG TPA: energy transducer TonB, partial [Pyrinomonadaceae bacterium]|nr:energy transducer TonB [Pyrinomonadaceae bacterium]